MIRRVLAIVASVALLSASPALAAAAQTPAVTNSMGKPVESQAVICTDAAGNFVGCGGSALSLATGQVSIGAASTLLVAARATRQRVTIVVNSAVACAFGNTGVTATTGLPLPGTVGVTVTLNTAAAIYGFCASTATVGYAETF